MWGGEIMKISFCHKSDFLIVWGGRGDNENKFLTQKSNFLVPLYLWNLKIKGLYLFNPMAKTFILFVDRKEVITLVVLIAIIYRRKIQFMRSILEFSGFSVYLAVYIV